MVLPEWIEHSTSPLPKENLAYFGLYRARKINDLARVGAPKLEPIVPEHAAK